MAFRIPRLRATNITPRRPQCLHQRRALIPAPTSGRLYERRPDRELPSLAPSYRWAKTLPPFIIVITLSALAIFNYQKSNSSVVASTLYALRTSPKARDILGDEIYFAAKVPWIRGELNQLHGRINLAFWVKGTKGMGRMRFRSERASRMGVFETKEWSLEKEDGEVVQLLDVEQGDPFKRVTVPKPDLAELD